MKNKKRYNPPTKKSKWTVPLMLLSLNTRASGVFLLLTVFLRLCIISGRLVRPGPTSALYIENIFNNIQLYTKFI